MNTRSFELTNKVGRCQGGELVEESWQETGSVFEYKVEDIQPALLGLTTGPQDMKEFIDLGIVDFPAAGILPRQTLANLFQFLENTLVPALQDIRIAGIHVGKELGKGLVEFANQTSKWPSHVFG